jgi:hypothetical protein
MICTNCGSTKDYGFCDNCLTPLNLSQLDDYINNALLIITFYLRIGQWDGITEGDIKLWLKNFKNDVLDRYLSIKLLNHIIYYSESDMELLLREAIFNRVISQEIILPTQIANNFAINNQDLIAMLNNEIQKTLFIPLLDGPRPDESGNQLMRILTQRLEIPTSQVKFHFFIEDSDSQCNRLVIIDDCMGSGQQCYDFWTKATIKDSIPLSEWCKANNIRVYYVVLVGYEKTIADIVKDMPELNICCMEQLNDQQRVFEPNSVFWADNTEKEVALRFFSWIAHEHNFSPFGYRNLDFALIMHKTIPDWNLHCLWKKRDKWIHLMRRKDSDV